MLDDSTKNTVAGKAEFFAVFVKGFDGDGLRAHDWSKQASVQHTAASFVNNHFFWRVVGNYGVNIHAKNICLVFGAYIGFAGFGDKDFIIFCYLLGRHAYQSFVIHCVFKVLNNLFNFL